MTTPMATSERMPTPPATRRPLVEPHSSTTTAEVVDWGRSGQNQMITLNAQRVLKAAGRLTLPAIRT
jgi:hypothetical protein